MDDAPVLEEQELDWRTYSESHELTQKQQKLAEKIKKLERRKEKLELESKRIHAKESQFEELTPGQITSLLKNEKSVEQLSEEIEELEEAIRTSILEKLNPSLAKSKADSKRHEDQSESDDDEFYDRSKKKSKHSGNEADSNVLSAETLTKEKDELNERLLFLRASLDEPEASDDAPAQEEDALDAFMDNLTADQKRQERHNQSKEVQDITTRLEEIEHLMKLVDPDSLYTRDPRKTL